MAAGRLKLLRAAAALLVLVALTAALADFRNAVPPRVAHWLTASQLVPSLLALAAGGLLALTGLVILAVTLLAGRIYCSVLCPLGILQDVIARITARWRPRMRFGHPLTAVRQGFLWATVVAIAVGWGGAALTLLDPYSNYGRIASGLFRPVLAVVNNAVVSLAGTAGTRSLFRVNPSWAGAGELAVPALVLTLVVVLSARRGRLYCNSVCPVGTLLGLLSRRAAFRLAIDPAVCSKCGDCLRVCKAQCIDLRHGALDFSRCVACYNCISACENHGIGYWSTWFRSRRVVSASAPRPAAAASMHGTAPDPNRRAFLAGAFLAAGASLGASAVGGTDSNPAESGRARGPETSPGICPPGSVGVDRYLNRCTACQLCVTACPAHVLRPARFEYGLLGFMKPRLDFSAGYCTYECRACGDACPDGTIDRLPLEEKKLVSIGEARLDLDLCIVKTKGTDCAACSEQCPTQAVFTEPYHDNLRLPHLNSDLCIGCGACENACPVQPKKSITVVGLRQHGRARKPVEKRLRAPVPTNGFPF